MTLAQDMLEHYKYLCNPLTANEKALLADYNRWLTDKLAGDEMLREACAAYVSAISAGIPCKHEGMKAALAVVREMVG